MEGEYNERFGKWNLSYITVGEFLANLKSEFGEGNDEMIKVAKLKKLE